MHLEGDSDAHLKGFGHPEMLAFCRWTPTKKKKTKKTDAPQKNFTSDQKKEPYSHHVVCSIFPHI